MRNPPTPNPGKSGQNDQRPPNQRSSGTSQVWLWTSLEPSTWLVGGIWLVIGVAIAATVTRGFRKPVPKLDFSGEAPTTIQID